MAINIIKKHANNRRVIRPQLDRAITRRTTDEATG